MERCFPRLVFVWHCGLLMLWSWCVWRWLQVARVIWFGQATPPPLIIQSTDQLEHVGMLETTCKITKWLLLSYFLNFPSHAKLLLWDMFSRWTVLWGKCTPNECRAHPEWSQKTPGVSLAFPPTPRTRAPAGSFPGGQTLSPAWLPRCSGARIPKHPPIICILNMYRHFILPNSLKQKSGSIEHSNFTSHSAYISCARWSGVRLESCFMAAWRKILFNHQKQTSVERCCSLNLLPPVFLRFADVVGRRDISHDALGHVMNQG